MEPLAYRMQPKNLESFVGQKHIIGKDKLLYRMIKSDKLSSIIFWGPPGCGKTSLAKIIATTTNFKFEKLNAANAGVADIKRIVEETHNFFENPSGKVVVFIDEIHRFNKLQQDALLPHVESGKIILIGATTENPYFEVNKALVSRSTIFKLEKLQASDIEEAIHLCLKDKVNGVGNYDIKIDENVIKELAMLANGDLRTAFNTLELAVLSTDLDENAYININIDTIYDCIQKKKIMYDKNSDAHYDNISAFIKSMRGSNADATLLYLARMIEAGEDPMFIARRIVVAASEDVGLANNNALIVASAAMTAVHQIGMPESRIILAHAAVVVANSRKSNSAYIGINKAIEDVRTKNTGEVPMHLRNAPIEEMKNHEYGCGYKYPHDYENGYVEQEYMTDEMKNQKYYIPKDWE
ncbi:MAG: replication-associated recombination protein A [Clostridia bacterium]